MKGRIIVVFGCGGDRDQHKREPMGRAVAQGADAAVVTNDNPRSEEPAKIAKAVQAGLLAGGFKAGAALGDRTFVVELDRRHAIRLAIEAMGPDDVVLIAGKGHENYQLVGKQKRRFDDRDEARRILAGEPPPPPLLFEDNTSEVTSDQVEDALEILAEAPESAPTTTQSVDPASIVDEVDMEPDIVSEEADDDDLVMIVEEVDGADGGGGTGDPPGPAKT